MIPIAVGGAYPAFFQGFRKTGGEARNPCCYATIFIGLWISDIIFSGSYGLSFLIIPNTTRISFVETASIDWIFFNGFSCLPVKY